MVLPESQGTKRIDCNGGEIPINKTKLVLSGRDPAQDIAFITLTASLLEDDSSVTDLDDPVMIIPIPIRLAQWRAVQPRFAPVMATFSGTDAKSYAPTPALNINGYGPIEFWFAATWTANPGYDPAIMAYSGVKGARFAFYVTGDRNALGIQSGPFYDTAPFDFSAGGLHHVAITTLGNSTVVMIDGELQPEALNFGFSDLPATSFTVGSIGKFSPFIGEIGQIRIWNEPVDPDVLLDFAWKPLEGQGPGAHPNIAELVGISAFGNPESSGFVFCG